MPTEELASTWMREGYPEALDTSLIFPDDALLTTTHWSRLIDEKSQLTYTAAWLKVTGS